MQAYSAFAEKGRFRINPQRSAVSRSGKLKADRRSLTALDAASLLLVRQHVQPALLLGGPRPPAGPFVLAGHHRPCARPAADRRVVVIVQGIVRNVVPMN